MRDRPLPAGWPESPGGIPILWIFVGRQCRAHASQEEAKCFFNHVCLSRPGDVYRYRWPAKGVSVIVILLEPFSKHEEARMMAELSLEQPSDIAVRYWLSTTVISYQPPYE